VIPPFAGASFPLAQLVCPLLFFRNLRRGALPLPKGGGEVVEIYRIRGRITHIGNLIDWSKILTGMIPEPSEDIYSYFTRD
jgi:hypothetical protein